MFDYGSHLENLTSNPIRLSALDPRPTLANFSAVLDILRSAQQIDPRVPMFSFSGTSRENGINIGIISTTYNIDNDQVSTTKLARLASRAARRGKISD